VVSKDEWDTKEGTGKSMKNALYVQWHGKRYLLGWSDVKQQKIKSVALAIVELRESEGIRQLVRRHIQTDFGMFNVIMTLRGGGVSAYFL